MRARRARSEDAGAIHQLIAHYAAQELLLPRVEDEIRAHIRRFLVLTQKKEGGRETLPPPVSQQTAQSRERLLGCVALEPYGADLAEIRSLAVDPKIRGRGLGVLLLQAALAAARRRKIARVFAVTHAPEFFARQGFAVSTRRALPEKIARDCRACPKARACELVAVIAVVCPDRVARHGGAVLAAASKSAHAV